MKLGLVEYQRVHSRGRPFTGAWIETLFGVNNYRTLVRRPFTGAWIETKTWRCVCAGKTRSPLHGGVD